MSFKELKKQNHFFVLVKPNAQKTTLLSYDGDSNTAKISVTSNPTNNQANKELLLFLNKHLGQCKIKTGLQARKKLIQNVS